MTSDAVKQATAQRAAARAWMARQPAFWALVALDVAAMAGGVVGYLITGSPLCFVPLALVGVAMGVVVPMLARRRAAALADPAEQTVDPLVQ